MRRGSWPALAAFLAIAAAAILWLYNQRTARQLKSEMFVSRETTITPEIELLQRYIRIDTSNPPGRELEGAKFLAAILEKNGVKAEIIESAPGRASLYARLRGKHSGEGLLMMNHIDVVPATSTGWTRPPFAASIALNMLYGRGSLDMKSIGICELEGFLAVARSGRTPERDIVFLGTADEEQGGKYGVAWLLEHRPDIFQGIRYALNEGGITETKQGRLSYFGIEIGSKMAVKVRLRAPTREAMQQARIALEPYVGPPDPDRILPEVREFLHQLSAHRVEQRPLLEDVVQTAAVGKFWLLSRGYRELTQNIVWPTTVARSPDGAALMEVILYNLPDEDPDRRVAWLKNIVAPFGATIAEVTLKCGPAPSSSPHTPLFALLEAKIHRQYGNVSVGTEMLAASFNDSRFLRARGISCYGMWPFPVDFYQTQGIHGIDERLRIDWFMSGIELMRDLVTSYAYDALLA